MINLPFLQELTEARLFQGAKDLRGMSAKEIGSLIYLLIMTLEVIRETGYANIAANYARDTMSYHPYENMHYAGTDLANLLAALLHQDTFADKIKPNKDISIPLFQINRYLSSLRSGGRSNNEDAQFFYRLEGYLKLYDSGTFRQLRRDVGNWDNLSKADKTRIFQLLRQTVDKSQASGTDLYIWFRQSYRIKESTELDTAPLTEFVDTKLKYHKGLNPALWEFNELKPDVKEALGRIANKFSEFVDIKQLKIVDYVITGSNCAFNYTDQSDIDLHVIVDATQLGADNPLTEPFLMAKKSLWNSGHEITIKGYNVEVYAEDINRTENQLVATGIYSLLHDKWIKEPSYKEVTIDDFAVQTKAEDIIQRIDSLVDNGVTDQAEIDRLWDHIRRMRKSGLASSGEFSVENLAFKAVRNNDYLSKLKDFEISTENQDLTLEQAVVYDAKIGQ